MHQKRRRKLHTLLLLAARAHVPCRALWKDAGRAAPAQAYQTSMLQSVPCARAQNRRQHTKHRRNGCIPVCKLVSALCGSRAARSIASRWCPTARSARQNRNETRSKDGKLAPGDRHRWSITVCAALVCSRPPRRMRELGAALYRISTPARRTRAAAAVGNRVAQWPDTWARPGNTLFSQREHAYAGAVRRL